MRKIVNLSHMQRLHEKRQTERRCAKRHGSLSFVKALNRRLRCQASALTSIVHHPPAKPIC